jgi:hypothetical protein
MKKSVFGIFYFIFVCCPCAFPQAVFRGKVIDAGSQKPLSAVSVYLNNTSLGTVSDEQGLFYLKNIPRGKFKLVATCVGFETWVEMVNPGEFAGTYIISMKPKSFQLEGVEVMPPDPDGWKKWGKLFKDIFIGTTPNSVDCHLDNPEVIKFRLNADNTLTVSASNPIVIKNYWLGYRITYLLEKFELDFRSGFVNYKGYALFKDLSEDHPTKAVKYRQERLKAYKGSLLHFMRTFFVNQLGPEGFEMRSLAKMYNPEKLRAKKMLRQFENPKDSGSAGGDMGKTNDESGMFLSPRMYADSIRYFKKVMLQPDSVTSKQLISADSVGFAVDSSTAAMYFPDSLQIAYLLEIAPSKYKAISRKYKYDSFQISQFVFPNKKAISILVSGYYYSPDDLKITGYWAWWENMTTKLPYDYSPSSPTE